MGRGNIFLLFVIIGLTGVLVSRQDYLIYLINIGGIYALLAISYNIILGLAGQFSFAHMAVAGISAYISSLLVIKASFSFSLAVVCGGLFTTLVVLPIGVLCFRFEIKEYYFAIMTMAFGELAYLVIKNWTSMTGGVQGLVVTDPRTPFEIWRWSVNPGSQVIWFYIIWLSVGLCILLTNYLMQSRSGRAMIAIREDDLLAQSIGINEFKYKLLAFLLGSFIAAIAGSFYGFYLTYIDPSMLRVFRTMDIVLMVLIGGMGTLFGPILGSLFMISLPQLLIIKPEVKLIVCGLIQVAIILFMPSGLAPKVAQLKKWLLTRMWKTA